MKFEQALAALREGKKVRKPAWFDHYIRLQNGVFIQDIQGAEYFNYPISISATDILAEDWEAAE